jgi:peptidoglycan/LPS O-acetylase OafA/YrhL
MKKIPIINQLRGLAILLVVAYHSLLPSFGKFELEWAGAFRNFDVPKQFLLMLPATFGWMGVAIFFSISGFCIHLSYATSHDKAWRAYLIKRTFRICPPYLCIMLFFALVFSSTKVSLSELWEQTQIIRHILLIHNFFPESFYGITGAFWTIAIEFQLYLLYPLIVSLTKRIGWPATCIILALIEFPLRLFASTRAPVAGLGKVDSSDSVLFIAVCSPLFYVFSWSIGAAVANVFLLEQKVALLRINPLPLFLIAIGITFFRPFLLFSFPLIAIATSIFIYQKSIANTPNSATFSWIAEIGTYSYSLYLVHEPLLGFIASLFVKFWHIVVSANISPPKVVVYIVTAGSLIVLIPISRILYYYLEKPSINFGKRILSR